MKRTATGDYVATTVGGQPVRAFIPRPLPPVPALDLGGQLQFLLHRAELALERLNGVPALLAGSDVFRYAFVAKEAALSSQIACIQASLSDLLIFAPDHAPAPPPDDTVEAMGNVDALEYGLERLRAGDPLSSELIREVHARMLAHGLHGDLTPGEFRSNQDWLLCTLPGRPFFVPPPPEAIGGCVADLERFLSETDDLPVLVKAALAQQQAETIHPFLNGNGRLARLLTTLILCGGGVLDEPLLYLSLYFERNRDEYFRLVDAVRQDGDWEEWVAFFLRGVTQTADAAVATARRLAEVFAADRQLLQGQGRRAASTLRIIDAFTTRPVLCMACTTERTGLSLPTVTNDMKLLTELGLVRELTGRKRNRVFAYRRALAVLGEDMEG